MRWSIEETPNKSLELKARHLERARATARLGLRSHHYHIAAAAVARGATDGQGPNAP